MTSTRALIDKLNNLLIGLAEKASNIDKKNSTNKAFVYRKDKAYFSETLFSTNSDSLFAYVQETQSKLLELESLIKGDKKQFSYSRLQLIEQQISALINAINANSTLNKAPKRQSATNKAIRYKNMAKHMMKNSQSLHQQLAETFEFERRLQVMLDAKQLELNNARASEQSVLSEQLLVLHQRLGRCRQAISKIERQIELSEKR